MVFTFLDCWYINTDVNYEVIYWNPTPMYQARTSPTLVVYGKKVLILYLYRNLCQVELVLWGDKSQNFVISFFLFRYQWCLLILPFSIPIDKAKWLNINRWLSRGSQVAATMLPNPNWSLKTLRNDVSVFLWWLKFDYWSGTDYKNWTEQMYTFLSSTSQQHIPNVILPQTMTSHK